MILKFNVLIVGKMVIENSNVKILRFVECERKLGMCLDFLSVNIMRNFLIMWLFFKVRIIFCLIFFFVIFVYLGSIIK